MPTAFDANLPDENKKLQYIIGVFQNANMVEAVEDDVKRCFKFQPFTDERNINLQKKCNRVSLLPYTSVKERITHCVFGIRTHVR